LPASQALAVAILPGVTALAVGEPDPIGGIVIAGGVPVPFAAPGYTGTLISTVIAGDITNPYGGLTFTYRLSNAAGSIHEIGRLTINDYIGWLTDASFQAPPAGLPPTLVNRSISGDVMGFSFVGAPVGLGALLPGLTSALLVIQTDAPAFKPTLASVINGSVVSVPSFAPTVPEPSSIVLAAMGLTGLAAWGWRRRKRRE